jgi:hypothetical protein
MPLIQTTAFSCASSPYAGVIPQPRVSALGGESYKYNSIGGKRGKSKKQQRRTKKAKQNRRSRRTRYNR